MWLLWEVVHPIRRHYTSSVRVYCPVTGVAHRIGCSAPYRVSFLLRFCCDANPLRGRASRGCVAASGTAGQGVWGGVARSCGCCGRWCTRSVGITPLLFGCSAPKRVQRDVTGAARRNGCSATRTDLVLQAWSASVTDSGRGRGSAWTPLMPTVTVCVSRSYVRKRRSTDAPEDNKQQGRRPSRVARAPPIAVRTRCDHRAGAAMVGVHIRCAAWTLTAECA